MTPPVDTEEYLKQRNALIQDDRKLRREYNTARHRSPLEVKADEIIREIRAKEAASIWTEDHLDVPHPFPGMEFLTGKYLVDDRSGLGLERFG
jgi:adenosine deaminase CECR1